MWNRAASVEYAGRAGVGCVVAPGVILTTRHVVEEGPGTEGEPRIVQVLGGGVPGPQAHAEVAWSRGEAALLRCRPRDLGQEFTPVRFGELACTNPPTPPECSAIGLPPTALRRLGSAPEEDRLPELPSAPVRIDIVEGTSGGYGLQVGHRPAENLPQRRSMAGQGMSGAAVFCSDLLMGMVTHGGDGGQEQLEAVPARQLLEDRRFCDILEEASGTRPRLEAADLDGLFDGLPQQAAAASYFLSPHCEVVGFTGLDTELSTLASWCNTPQSVDVAVVEGPGGVGKTRLGVELARRLSERRPEAEWQPGSPDIPWTAGFLSRTPVGHAPAYTMLRYLTRPALIVIDHAEARLEQVEQLLGAVAGGHTPARPIRVLLLTHSSRGWWDQFQARHAGRTTGVHISLETGALYRHHTPAQIQELAEISYSRRLVNLHRAGVSDDWDIFQAADTRAAHAATARDSQGSSSALPAVVINNQRSVLSVHMDALASVLLGSPGELTDSLPASVTLLDHELTYIRRTSTEHRNAGTGADPELVAALTALTGMAGVGSAEEAQAVIETAWQFHHRTQPGPLQDDTLTHLSHTLARLYPSPDGSPWGNPGPHTLTAALIQHLENNSNTSGSGGSNSSGGFLAHVLPSPHLTPRQRHHALALVGHALADHPHLASTTAHTITAHPLLLALPATRISEQLPQPARDIWLTALRNAATQRTHHPQPATTTPGQGTAPTTPATTIPDPPPAARPAMTAAHPAHTRPAAPPPPAGEPARNNTAPPPLPTAAGPTPQPPTPPDTDSWDVNHSSTAQLFAMVTIPLTILLTVLWALLHNP